MGTPKNQLEFNFSTSPIEIPTVAAGVPHKKLKSEVSFDEDLDCSVVDLDDFEGRE